MTELDFPFRSMRANITMRCNFHCCYCGLIYYQEDLYRGDEYAPLEVSPEIWIENINRCVPGRKQLTVIIGTGEPGIYEGMAEIVNNVKFTVVVYTNCSTAALKEYKKMVPRHTLLFYVTYHANQIDIDEFIENGKWLQSRFRIQNFHAPSYPPFRERILRGAEKAESRGVHINTKHPYLGWYNDEYHWYGKTGEQPVFKNRFMSRIAGVPEREVLCKVSLDHKGNTMGYPIAPNGDIYVCWRYFLNHSKEGILGNFFDEGFQYKDEYYQCPHYSDCNMCAWHRDIKDAKTREILDTDT